MTMIDLIAQKKNNKMSNREKIVEQIRLDFDKNQRYPFPSTTYWQWLGHSRHSNFKRFLNKEINYDQIVWDECFPNKVNSRRRESIRMSRMFFYQLAVKKHPGLKSFLDELYSSGYAEVFRKNILNFRFTKKKEWRQELNIGAIAGYFYTYSLNTYNVSKELNICPFELFKFASINFCRAYGFGGTRFINSHTTPIPLVFFDSLRHQERYKMLLFLDKVYKEFKLSKFQKLILKSYASIIKELIDKQIEYDIQIGRNGLRKKIVKKRQSPPHEVRMAYLKAAKLCHPDKFPERADIFLKLQSAWENQRFIDVTQIYRTLENLIPSA